MWKLKMHFSKYFSNHALMKYKGIGKSFLGNNEKIYVNI